MRAAEIVDPGEVVEEVATYDARRVTVGVGQTVDLLQFDGSNQRPIRAAHIKLLTTLNGASARKFTISDDDSESFTVYAAANKEAEWMNTGFRVVATDEPERALRLFLTGATVECEADVFLVFGDT